jgi:8-oxo-dGTP pyrophosphatase MutT (NUDIX family)
MPDLLSGGCHSCRPDPADRPSTIRNAAWRTAYRLGFPLARIWWRLRRQRHEGALVAVHVGQALLLVRSSYRIAWNFPGGTIRRGETPEIAARRELAEEIGLTGYRLLLAGTDCGIWDVDRVHFFELWLEQLPEHGSTTERSSARGSYRPPSCAAWH